MLLKINIKVVAITILAIVLASNAVAISREELLSFLKPALRAYFENPAGSEFTKEELRDFLLLFFETEGNEIDIDKIGKYSGKSMIELYLRGKVAKWTIMVFMNGDNNLEYAGIRDFNEMEQVGSSKEVNVIVQLDRTEEHDVSNGNWTTTKRFYITKDEDIENINSRELIDLGEVNMGSVRALADFVIFATENYPAKHYVLILWNHGGGWTGLSNDDTDDPDGTSLQELAEALKDIKNKKQIKLDIIGFDMCSMGMLEVWSEIAEFANIGIGSEELEPGAGWDYEGLLKFITENPNTDERNFATQIIHTFYDSYNNTKKQKQITLSAIDLNKISDVNKAISEAVISMNANMDIVWKELTRNMYEVDKYTSTDRPLREIGIPFGTSYIDLFHLFELLIPTSQNRDLYTKLVDAQNAVVNSVITDVAGQNHKSAAGLSVYWPISSYIYDKNYDVEPSQFISKTRWNEMIKNYYSKREFDTELPYVKIDNYQINPETIDFKVNLSGNDILALFFVVSQLNPFNNNISNTWLNAPILFDFTGFENGQKDYSWDKTVPSLSNGDDVTFTSFGFGDLKGKQYFAYGLYNSTFWDEVFDAKLFFNEGELSSIYVIDEYVDTTTPSELEEILPDDVFIPYLTAFDSQTFEFFPYEGIPIKMSSGLSIKFVKLTNVSQDYFLSFRAEDLSGNFAIDGIIP